MLCSAFRSCDWTRGLAEPLPASALRPDNRKDYYRQRLSIEHQNTPLLFSKASNDLFMKQNVSSAHVWALKQRTEETFCDFIRLRLFAESSTRVCLPFVPFF